MRRASATARASAFASAFPLLLLAVTSSHGITSVSAGWELFVPPALVWRYTTARKFCSSLTTASDCARAPQCHMHNDACRFGLSEAKRQLRTYCSAIGERDACGKAGYCHWAEVKGRSEHCVFDFGEFVSNVAELPFADARKEREERELEEEAVRQAREEANTRATTRPKTSGDTGDKWKSREAVVADSNDADSYHAGWSSRSGSTTSLHDDEGNDEADSADSNEYYGAHTSLKRSSSDRAQEVPAATTTRESDSESGLSSSETTAGATVPRHGHDLRTAARLRHRRRRIYGSMQEDQDVAYSDDGENIHVRDTTTTWTPPFDNNAWPLEDINGQPVTVYDMQRQFNMIDGVREPGSDSDDDDDHFTIPAEYEPHTLALRESFRASVIDATRFMARERQQRADGVVPVTGDVSGGLYASTIGESALQSLGEQRRDVPYTGRQRRYAEVDHL